jgi:hypothetical protein
MQCLNQVVGEYLLLTLLHVVGRSDAASKSKQPVTRAAHGRLHFASASRQVAFAFVPTDAGKSAIACSGKSALVA